MNVQFNNWQLIDLNAFASTLSTALTKVDNIFNGLDPNGPVVNVNTNTLITGSWFDFSSGANYSLEMKGSGFLAAISTVNYLGLTDSNHTIQYFGSVTYNANIDVYSGYFNKITYDVISPTLGEIKNFEFSGRFNLNATGAFSGGTASAYTISTDGYIASLTGSFALNALGDVVSGSATGFSFTDNLGHTLAVSGTSINYSVFDNLTDPATGHTDLSALYTLITDPTTLAGNDTIIADAQDNNISGFAGNDSLSGGAGADVLVGGKGEDT